MGENGSNSFLLQQVSVANQRLNAARIAESMGKVLVETL